MAGSVRTLSRALLTGIRISPGGGGSFLAGHQRATVLTLQCVRPCTASKADVDASVKKFKEGKYDTLTEPSDLKHPLLRENAGHCGAVCKSCRCRKKEQVRYKSTASALEILETQEQAGVEGDQQEPTRLDATKEDVEANVQKFREGKYNKNISDPADLQHFRSATPSDVKDEGKPIIGAYAMAHPIWSEEEVHGIKITHKPPEGFVDRAAYYTIQTVRFGFDVLSGYKFGETNEKKWLTRIIFLETVAAVPGMVAAMVRHLHSLRRMRRDHGWIHTLLEEAENERMHLMTALQLRKPSTAFRLAVMGTQGVFVTAFGLTYLISPRFCHRMVGYLEEEAVITYTKCIKDIQGGNMKHWQTQPAPQSAIRYWKLAPDAVMLDVILAIRADEAHHRIVNHTLASLKPEDYNPYKPGK